MAVLVNNTPPPKPKAKAPTTVPTPRRYEYKENGMIIPFGSSKANAQSARRNFPSI
jgi:hypothetical protein